MINKWCVMLAAALGVAGLGASGPTITIDAASSSGKVSPLFYGLMTEEINHSYDGGLYAELVRNRAFLDDPAAPAHWSVVQGDGGSAAIALDPSQPLNATIGTSLRVDVAQASSGHPAGVANDGYWGVPSGRIPDIVRLFMRKVRLDSADRSRYRSRALMVERFTRLHRSRV